MRSNHTHPCAGNGGVTTDNPVALKSGSDQEAPACMKSASRAAVTARDRFNGTPSTTVCRRATVFRWLVSMVVGMGVPPLSQATHQWVRVIGEGGIDYSVAATGQTSDGGCIITGRRGSPPSDFWIAKLDAGGGLSWQKTFGGVGHEWPMDVSQTADGGYVVGGSTISFGDGYQTWVLKLDASGTVVWQKTYGGTGSEFLQSVQQTADGGYIVAGSTNGFGASATNAWTLKLSGTGTVEWQRRRFTNQVYDFATSMKQIPSGVYGMVGTAEGNGGSRDVWFLRLSSSGGATDRHIIGSSKDESAANLDPSADGGWFVAGSVDNTGSSGYDGLLMKLNSTGSPSWQRLVVGSGSDSFSSGQPTADGGYIAVGYTESAGSGGKDVWVVKFDSSGSVSWQRTYGGANDDAGEGISQTADGGYLVAGWSRSYGSTSQVIVLRISPSGEIDPSCGSFVHSSAAAIADLSVTDDTSMSSYATTTATVASPAYSTAGTSAIDTALCTSSCQVSCAATVPTSGVVGIVVPFATSASLVDCNGGAVSYLWTFGDGATSVDQNPSHGHAAPGDYPWTLSVTAPGASPCSQSGSVAVSATAMPDLTGIWTSVKKKSKVNASLACQNVGLGDASSFAVKIYFSKKSSLSKKSKLIKTQTVPSLAAGASLAVKIKATPPNKYKYLVAVLDSDGAVGETNEGNNIVTTVIP